MQCQVETGVPKLSSYTMVQIPDDGVIEVACNREHRTCIIIQQEKFEILSDMAIKAIVDGYYRDAVSSFAGSLERLYEFFVRATCRKHGIDALTFAPAWKEMSNQSERQLGAFIGVHLMETGQPPKLLPQKQTSFRNAVIHKGKFPERDDALRFGQAVLECALPILRLLKSEPYSSTVQTLVMESIRDRSMSARKEGMRTSTQCISTFLSLATAEEQTDVRTAVTNYAAWPNFEEILKTSATS